MTTPTEIFLKDYSEPSFWCSDVHLDVDVYDDHTTVINTSTFKSNPNNHSNTLELDGVMLDLISVKVDGNTVSSENVLQNETNLIIKNLPESFTLTTEVKINPFENFSGEGFYKSGDILCTQCEAEGFQRISYFQDRPDVMSKFTTTLRADKKRYPILLSNGNLSESFDIDGDRHGATWIDPFKKPCYLFAMVAGNLAKVSDKFKTKDNREVALEIFVDPGNEKKCDHAMESLKHSMKWDEERFGLIYDLDIYMIVAVDSFNMGAMENKGLNIFNSHYVLASQTTATDSDFQGVEAVIGHEYFHNWTGNRVTCRDWFQLTLKEGLTVFRDQEFSSDMGSRAVKRIEDVARVKAHQFPEDSGSLSHPIQPKSYIEINNFYTATVYEKGAEVIRMIHTLLGENNFRAGMDLYFKRHDGQAVTCSDFVSAMSDASGVNLDHFSVWYDQNGTPILNIETLLDTTTSELIIRVKQDCKTNNADYDSLFMPFHFDVYSQTGVRLAQSRDVLKEKNSELRIPNIKEEVVLAFNTNFSAPVRINYAYSYEELIVLMAHAEDHYTRYNSARIIYEREIKSIIEQLKIDGPVEVNSNVVSAIKNILEDKSIDDAFKAYLLSLPTQKELFDKWDNYDFDKTKEAIKLLKIKIATDLEASINKTVQSSLNQNSEYTLSSEDIGKRALYNQCISFLGYLQNPDFFKSVFDTFSNADNMTIEFGTLSVLLNHENEFQEKASKKFYDKWKSETLVVQKWLSLCAKTSTMSVAKLELLEQLPEYDPKVPNLVRSLIGAFSTNIYLLNDKSGESYKFFVKKIGEIDSYNPQLAARLAKNINYLKKLDDSRSKLLSGELKKLLDSGKLSNDCFEVIKAIIA